MTQNSKQPRVPGRPDPTTLDFIEAIKRPTRAKILAVLSDRDAGVRDLAAEVGESPSTVRRHLRALRAVGLAALADTKRRRGVAEHYFTLQSRQYVDDGSYADLSPAHRRRVVNYTLGLIVTDVRRAVRNWSVHAHRAPVAIRVRLELDEQGWDELGRICADTLARVERLKEETGSRLASHSGERTLVSTAIMALRLPSDSAGAIPAEPD